MDNIQKSVIFVLATVGILTLILDSAVYRAARGPEIQASAPADNTAAPAPADISGADIASEETDDTDDDGDFGDPVLDTDPVSDQELESGDNQNSGERAAVNVSAQGQGFNSTPANAAPASSRAEPAIQQTNRGSTLPPPPPPIPGPPIAPPER